MKPNCDETKHPTLSRLVKDGTVKATDDGWIGKAEDGIEIQFSWDADMAERYLRAHPTPDQW